jgi:hypothetical protein
MAANLLLPRLNDVDDDDEDAPLGGTGLLFRAVNAANLSRRAGCGGGDGGESSPPLFPSPWWVSSPPPKARDAMAANLSRGMLMMLFWERKSGLSRDDGNEEEVRQQYWTCVSCQKTSNKNVCCRERSFPLSF